MENAIAQANSPENIFSLRQIARDFGVPYFTLHDRVHARPNRSQGHKSQQKLTEEEENALATHLVRLASHDWPPSLRLLRQIASTLLRRRAGDKSAQVGRNWHLRFLKRHPELSEAWSTSLGSKRAEAGESGHIVPFLECLQALRLKYNVAVDDLWNMDEKGFILGFGERTRLIVRVSHKEIDRQRRTAGNREHVSLVKGVFARGERVSPLIIFKAKQKAIKWAEGIIPEGKPYLVTITIILTLR